MKASIVFATVSMLAAGAVFGIDAARAGQGGAAGSISAQFDADGYNVLTATAGAVAVGKAGAATTAKTSATDISAVAVGNSGTMEVSGINSGATEYLVDEDLALETAQANTLNSPANLRLGTGGISIPAAEPSRPVLE